MTTLEHWANQILLAKSALVTSLEEWAVSILMKAVPAASRPAAPPRPGADLPEAPHERGLPVGTPRMRADGRMWRKVAPGKWVPVDQAQRGAKEEDEPGEKKRAEEAAPGAKPGAAEKKPVNFREKLHDGSGVSFTDDEEAANVAMNLFGPEATAQDLAAVIGAPPGSSVTIETLMGDEGYSIEYEGPHVRAIREFIRKPGRPVMTNLALEATEGAPKGTGSRVFVSQVFHAQRLGVAKIECTAGGYSGHGHGLNGYYTWPRLGYAPWKQSEIDKGIDQRLQNGRIKSEPPTRDLVDMMTTQEGRDWWKANGFAFEANFDLTPGSHSMDVVSAYAKKRAELWKSILVGFEALMKAFKSGRKTEEIDLDDDEHSTLDEVWEIIAQKRALQNASKMATHAVNMLDQQKSSQSFSDLMKAGFLGVRPRASGAGYEYRYPEGGQIPPGAGWERVRHPRSGKVGWKRQVGYGRQQALKQKEAKQRAERETTHHAPGVSTRTIAIWDGSGVTYVPTGVNLTHAAQDVFGPSGDKQMFAAMVGAPPGSRVAVHWEKGSRQAELHISRHDFEATRTIDGAHRTITNNSLSVTGFNYELAMRMFASSATNASNKGFHSLETRSVRARANDSYFNHAVIGYRPSDPGRFRRLVHKRAGQDGVPKPPSDHMHTMMSTKAGRDWWKRYGFSYDASFDLHPSSHSMQIVSNFMRHKVKSGTWKSMAFRGSLAKANVENMPLSKKDYALFEQIYDKAAEDHASHSSGQGHTKDVEPFAGIVSRARHNSL
jgi:hypothetical protein